MRIYGIADPRNNTEHQLECLLWDGVMQRALAGRNTKGCCLEDKDCNLEQQINLNYVLRYSGHDRPRFLTGRK
jgi:hypothetical protein